MNKILSLGAAVLVSLALSGCSSGTPPTSDNGITADPPAQESPTPNTYSGGDKDCGDFSTHAQAQAYFEAKGGSPSNNVDRLDRDRDGIACETLP